MSQVNLSLGASVARITLDSPDRLNALSLAMWQQLHQHVVQLEAHPKIRCIVISGAGGHFAAGADIREFEQVRSTSADGRHYHMNVIAPTLEAISTSSHVTVAAIEGNCMGGGLEIASACDLRIAHESARFGIPVHRLGFPLAPLELKALLQLCGKATALELLLEGRIYGAQEAKDKGLIQRVSNNLEQAVELAIANVLRGAPEAARVNKLFVRRFLADSSPLTEDELQTAFAFLETSDYREGIMAFLDKRDPDFQDT